MWFSCCDILTHLGWDKMVTIFQMTYSNAFSCMKIYEFRLRFHWSLFVRVQLTISIIGSDNGLAPTGQQAITWTNVDLDPCRHMASLGVKELIKNEWLGYKLQSFPALFLSLCAYYSISYLIQWTCMCYFALNIYLILSSETSSANLVNTRLAKLPLNF